MQMSAKKTLQEYYEDKLKRNGVNFSGLDWPDIDSTIMRYTVMSDLFRRREEKDTKFSLVDIGCGAGFYVDYMRTIKDFGIDYFGIDISPVMIQAATQIYPDEQFEVRDILQNPLEHKAFDYALLNGVLTVKSDIPQEEMFNFAKDFVVTAFSYVRKGLAVNFMSEHVDWKREDLFHLPLDEAASFFRQTLTRHVEFRLDYGLWEYTAYLYRDPTDYHKESAFASLIDRLEGAS